MTRISSDPDHFVADALRGFALAHRDDVSLVDGGVVRATPLTDGHVAVLIGGGSGHYPAFAGYVGTGMAAGAVCGNIFSSPSTGQALRVAHAAEAGGGVLFTYGNYAGDVIHFGEAERRLRAEGVDARTVLITDDVASAPRDAVGDRRGIAGIVCVFHIAGAAAERGDSLDDVERLARHANSRTITHGVAFGGCTLPGADHALFEVPEGMMSIGLGIHGEPGVRDVPLQQADELARTLLAPLLEERPADGSRAVVLVNGLGAVKYEELYLLYGHVADVLAEEGITVADAVVGELVTSLDMAGASVTLLWLDPELEELWDAPASSPAFRNGRGRRSSRQADAPDGARTREGSPSGDAAGGLRPRPQTLTSFSVAAEKVAREALVIARDVVAENVAMLGELDAVAGDGDHGVGMLRGLNAAVAHADGIAQAVGVRDLLEEAGAAWADVAGGTSGALWGAALGQLGSSLEDAGECTPHDLAEAVAAARRRIEELGGAQIGDKTMLDAIVPFEDALAAGAAGGASLAAALTAAAAAAAEAAAASAALTPKRGRARPLAERSVGHPDPGATSFSLIVDALARRIHPEG